MLFKDLFELYLGGLASQEDLLLLDNQVNYSTENYEFWVVDSLLETSMH